MKLHGVIHLEVTGEDILARPGLLAKLRRAFGGEPDLRTGRRRASLEAAAVVDAARKALAELGATNALSLVVDDVVLFQDRDRRADDLGDLFLAFHEHSSVFGEGFRLLRLAIEHEEAGNHLVLEVQARTEHPADEPAVRIVISGRIQAFEPRAGDTAESYRARVEPLLRDRTVVELAQRSFEHFVLRVRDAIARAMPEAEVEVDASEPSVTKPDARRREPAPPTSAHYDPHEAHYGSSMYGVMALAMWSSMLMASGLAPYAAGAASSDGDDGGSDDGLALDFEW